MLHCSWADFLQLATVTFKTLCMYKTFWLHDWSHIHEYNHILREIIAIRFSTEIISHTPHIIIVTLCDSFMSSLSGFHLHSLTCIIHYTQAQGHLQQRYYCLQFALPLIADLCCVLLLLAWTPFLLYQLLDYAAQHVHVGRYAACTYSHSVCDTYFTWYSKQGQNHLLQSHHCPQFIPLLTADLYYVLVLLAQTHFHLHQDSAVQYV